MVLPFCSLDDGPGSTTGIGHCVATARTTGPRYLSPALTSLDMRYVCKSWVQGDRETARTVHLGAIRPASKEEDGCHSPPRIRCVGSQDSGLAGA
jgi:hypothetical protein